MQSLLSSVLMAMRVGKPDLRALVPSLMAYAKALEWDAKWELASDVYQGLLAHLHPIEDSEACVDAHLRLGVCYRSQSAWENALRSYESVFEIGNATGDIEAVLRSRIGEADVDMYRGNLPRAAMRYEALVEAAKASDHRDVRARALMGRAGVAALAQQYELAIRLGYEALDFQDSPTERDRVLSNIAVAFHHLGVFSAARDAYLVLSVTAREQYMRWTATLNLMDLATTTGSEVLFEQYRRELSGVKLPPQLETGFAISQGEGLRQFGQHETARQYLVQAIGLARRYGLNQFMMQADAALAGIYATAPHRRDSVQLPTELEDVALAIRQLRELSGVS
jgi:tetratricopeptide (TPR) repeat protein